MSPNIAQFNPYFCSLQRQPNFTPNIVDNTVLHQTYGLPDVIRLQNYGMLPLSNDNDIRQIQNEYRQSMLDLELKRCFNSLLNLSNDVYNNDHFSGQEHQLKELNTENWLSNNHFYNRNFNIGQARHLIENSNHSYQNSLKRVNNKTKNNESQFYSIQSQNILGQGFDYLNDCLPQKNPNKPFDNEKFNDNSDDCLNSSDQQHQFSNNFDDELNNIVHDSSDSLHDNGNNKEELHNTSAHNKTGAWVNFSNV